MRYEEEIGETYINEVVECDTKDCYLYSIPQDVEILVTYSERSASGSWVCSECNTEYEWTGDTPEFDDPRDEYDPPTDEDW